jgi:hypothetical protein
MARVRVAITVRVASRRGRRRGSDEVKIVGEEFRLAKRRRVVAPEVVILEF